LTEVRTACAYGRVSSIDGGQNRLRLRAGFFFATLNPPVGAGGSDLHRLIDLKLTFMNQSDNESISNSNRFKIETSTLRAYTMLLALVLIWIFFHLATGCKDTKTWSEWFGCAFSFGWIREGVFLSPRNLSNLMTQTAVTGVIAVGMLMVIVAGQIDLSVGSVLGLAGGIAACQIACDTSTLAQIFSNQNSRLVPALFAAILICVLIGLINGVLVAYGKIPAFIVTLGGLLAWRGAIKGYSQGETIPVALESFKSIGQKYLDKNVGWVIAIVAILAVVALTINAAKKRQSYGLGAENPLTLGLRILIPSVSIVAFVFVMNSYAGIPNAVLILIIVALIGTFLTQQTTFGRYLYAIGGNPDAARLSGISIQKHILLVYALLGALTGVAAIIYTARQGSASPDAGVLSELDAIAACVIGGASLMGGRGTVIGACVGALIMASLDNGMSLLNVGDYKQDIVKGSILVAAVGLDMVGRRQC